MMFSATYPILTGAPVVAFASLLIAALTRFNYSSIDPKLRPKNTPTEEILPEYDFIVVGAGSAGSVVASRLSEIREWRVLLLEAGGDESAISDTPYLTRDLENTYFDWQFKTEVADNVCLASPYGRCNWPRGKVLGGSSAIGGTLYVRGNRRDYDLWESLGNPGWGYKDVLYYFKKSEGVRVPWLRDSPYHSTAGPLTVSPASYRTVLGTAFLHASKEVGYPIIKDYNGETQTGFARYQFATRDGHRCSTAKAFLRPARCRQNLDIAYNSYVTRVLINPTTNVAFGVEFTRNGDYYTVKARKEVIVCAGSVKSPQLLMLSGIGPKRHLEELSIPVLQDLQVGYNLQDHVGLNGVTFGVDKPIITNDQRLVVEKAVNDYAESGSGILTFANFEIIANVRSKYINQSDDWPDIHLDMYPCSFAGTPGNSVKNQTTCNAAEGRLPACDCWGIYISLNRAKSKGKIKLRNNNPFEYPILIPNYLTEEIDLLTMVEAAKISLKIAETKVMQKFGSKYIFDNTNCTDFTVGSDEFWKCRIRYDTRSAWHMAGTCKMGPCSDPEAVVDPQLRVYGVERLRVVDVSIMPVIVSGNTQAPGMMIGEKGADLIKRAWRNRQRSKKYATRGKNS